jgi:hypothetical protein
MKIATEQEMDQWRKPQNNKLNDEKSHRAKIGTMR